MGTSRIFSRDYQIRGLETKVSSAVQGWGSGGDLGAKPQKLTTGCENNA